MKHERNAATRDVLDDWCVGFAKFWNIRISVEELKKAGFKRKYPADTTQIVLGRCAARY